MPKSTPKIPVEYDHLADAVGQFMQYWGFKKIHGQVWVHLFLTKKPLTSAALVKRIGVSKTFISFAIKELLEYKVIQIVNQPDKRKVLLQANPNFEEVIVNVLRSREKILIDTALKAEKNFSALSKDTKNQLDLDEDRLESLHTLIHLAHSSIDYLIKNNLQIADCEKD